MLYGMMMDKARRKGRQEARKESLELYRKWLREELISEQEYQFLVDDLLLKAAEDK